MSTDTTVSPLRQRMIEDMAARKLGPHSQRSRAWKCREAGSLTLSAQLSSNMQGRLLRERPVTSATA